MQYHPETRLALSQYSSDKRDGYFKYRQQAFHCKNRFDAKGQPITMEMTFEEWWKAWQDSGHYHERGCKHGQYYMGRRDDLGSYAVGNVSIVEHRANTLLGKVDVSKKIEPLKIVDTCPHCHKSGARGPMRLADNMAAAAASFNSHGYDQFILAREELQNGVIELFEKTTPMVGS